LTGASEAFGQFSVFQQAERFGRTIFDAFYQVVVVSGRKLHGYSARVTCDNRSRLPKCLGDHKSKSFTERFLEHHIGGALEGVDLHAADAGEISEYVKVGIVGGLSIDLVQDSPCFGIVSSHCAKHSQLNFWPRFLDDAIGADDTERIFPGIKTRNLRQQWTMQIYAHFPNRAVTNFCRQLHVLG